MVWFGGDGFYLRRSRTSKIFYWSSASFNAAFLTLFRVRYKIHDNHSDIIWKELWVCSSYPTLEMPGVVIDNLQKLPNEPLPLSHPDTLRIATASLKGYSFSSRFEYPMLISLDSYGNFQFWGYCIYHAIRNQKAIRKLNYPTLVLHYYSSPPPFFSMITLEGSVLYQ